MTLLAAIACSFSAFASTSARAADTVSPTATQAITALLSRSAQSWNAGKLDDFMQSYENSPETVYVSSKIVIHGYANIRAHYASSYGSNHGTLTISDIAIRELGSDYAVLIAHWHLAMPGGKHPTGIFSLVLHRSNSGWHIITDHSP